MCSKKYLSIVLTLSMIFSMLPTMSNPSYAASSPEKDVAMNALDALGFDTSIMPDGFDATSTNNPYGGKTATVNQVRELYTADKDKGELYGQDLKLGKSASDFYASTKSACKAPAYDAYYAAPGDFTGDGLEGEVVTVAANVAGGLSLYWADPTMEAEVGAENTKLLLSGSAIIGNEGRYDKEDFVKEPYQLQNYLQTTTGDFDGDGYDEIAVYLPEQGDSRVAVFKLKITTGSQSNHWLKAENWELAWTYSLKESPFVSNMVSLTASDMTGDGVDDLAITWGVYYGKDYKTKCQATVLCGSKDSKYLQKSSSIALTYGTSEIVRAALTFGDADGDGKDELVLGGQLENDIDAGEYNTRFLAIYEYNQETGFIRTSAENMNMIEKKNENGQYPASEDQRYFSAPACVANMACLKMDGIGTQEYIYLDSVLYQEKSGSFEIKVELDEAKDMRDNRQFQDYPYYAEYHAIAADFNGDGKETLQLSQYFLPFDTRVSTRKYWWFIPVGWNTTNVSVAGEGWLKEVDASVTKSTSGQSATFAAGSTLWALPVTTHAKTLGSTLKLSYCAPDTDIDTSKIVYTGKHYMTYTDPKVLAVLSSPPYFGDLGHLDGGDSYVCNSETTYGVTKGGGSGSTKSSTISVGAYVSFEHEFTVFGVPVAKVESEVEYTHGWTKEVEKVRNVEQQVTYGTFAGQDAVAFYSIPMEVYLYDSYVPILSNGKLTYEKQTMTVNIPYTAQVKTLSLDSYEDIAANYKELPAISAKVLTHEVGEPSTYPTSIANYKGVNIPQCDFSGVDYDSLGFNKQSLDITREESISTSQSNAVNAKVGAGPGSVVVGVTAGYEGGSGKITTSMEGSTFEGVVVNMPASAKDNGYHYSWKVFQYTYTNGDISFPVVDYLVTDVTSPPKLPIDFALNTAKTSDTSITLSWTCNDAAVAGYQVYRHYDFPDGSGDYAVGNIIPGGVYGKQLIFKDTNLNPYTKYEYRIQAIGATAPYESVLSDILVGRTKASWGEPTITLSKQAVIVYPDKPEFISVAVENNAEHVQPPLYQWQKNVDGNWKDLDGAVNSKFTFSSAGVTDAGEYRCRVNQMVADFAISSYSDIVNVKYEKRTADMQVKVTKPISDQKGPNLQATLSTSSTDSGSVATGNVTFEILGKNYYQAYTSSIQNGVATYDNVPALPNGIYEISAYYGGSRIFESNTAKSQQYLSGIEEGYWMSMNEKVSYGDEVQKIVNKFTDKNSTTSNEAVTDQFQYKVMKEETTRSAVDNSWVYTTHETEMIGWVTNGLITAKEVGNYILVASATTAGTDGTKAVVSKGFSVTKRPLSLEAPTLNKVAKTDEAVHPAPSTLKVINNTFAHWDTIDSLGINVECRNTADKVVTIGSNTEPGNYTTIGTAPTGKLSNYEVTWKKGIYTLTGVTYKVDGIADKLLGDKVGSIQVISPSEHDNTNWATKYQAGTEIIFMASPLVGYKIDKWQINGNDLTTEQKKEQKNSNMLVYTMKSEPLKVSVSFQVGENTLEFSGAHGKVECSNSNLLKSGAIVIKNAEYTFKAIPDQGYHFKEWWLVSGNTTYPTGNVDQQGYHTYALTMPGASAKLFAVFERDQYEITLGDYLEATYLNDHDHNASTTDVAITVSNGASIPGDKKVTVRPVAGYLVSDQGKWYVDGNKFATAPDDPATPGDDAVYYHEQSYTFTMSTNTAIRADLELQHYTVKVGKEIAGGQNNQVDVMVNGKATSPNESSEITNLEGGSQLVFTATPSYGYVFEKWIVNQKEDTTSGRTLTMAPLGNNLAVTAVFKQNTSYEVQITKDIHGQLTYAINDGEDIEKTDNVGIKVFEGDRLTLTAIPDHNFMVGKWIVDGKESQTTSKTWILNNITKDTEVEVTFTPMSYYTVDFSAGDKGGITAKMEDEKLQSGDKPGGGSKIIFTATPEKGYLVEEWKIRNGKSGDFQTVKTKRDTTYLNREFAIESLSDDTEVEVSFMEEKNHIVTMSAINGSVKTIFEPDEYVNEGKVRHGAAATFQITPDEGYRLKGVIAVDEKDKQIKIDQITKEKDGTWICIFNQVTSDLTVTAELKDDKPYHLTLVTATGGVVSPILNKVYEGDEINLVANANTNYQFNRWKVTKIEDVLGQLTTKEITDILIGTPTKSAVNFSMPAYDITITPSFTYSGTTSNGGGSASGGGGGAISTAATTKAAIIELDNIVYGNGRATVTVVNEKIEFSEKAAAQLVKDNSKMEIVISGRGVMIFIPVGTLTSSSNLNTMLKGVTKGGNAVRYTDPQGKVSMVKFCLNIDGILKLIADRVGIYGTIDQTKSFRDTKDHWAKASIDFASNHELFSGTGNDCFEPNGNMTRGMFVTVLGRLDGKMVPGTARFHDVDEQAWYAAYVSWAATNQIVSGMGNENFGPEIAITREQLCVMLSNYMDYAHITLKTVDNNTIKFTDQDKISSWATDAVTRAQQTGLISGKPDGSFDPQGTATRAEVATVMLQFTKAVLNQR